MIKPVAHAVFGLTAYLSVVWVLVLSVPIFLLGLNQPETFNNPTIQTIASFICNFTITKTTVENPVAQGSVFSSIVHNLFLFTIFGVTHTILATVSMKVKLGNFLKQITFGVVDYDWNRSIFNFVAAAQLWFIMMYYQAVPDVIFQLPEGVKWVAYLINALGVVLLLACTIQVDHLEFFGLRKALRIENDFLRIHPANSFIDTFFYGFCRHPIMLSLLMMFWSFPVYTVGHLQWSVMTTGYILIGVYCFEEPKLALSFPKKYDDYKRETGAFCPMFRQKKDY
jgi:protein-S-isoprenylcysteine O-methyltransferase Ste14